MVQFSNHNVLIGFNFGKFLPRNIIQSLYHVYDRFRALSYRYDYGKLNQIDLDTLILEYQPYNAEAYFGGKDTLFLIKVKIDEFTFVLKFYPFSVFEILMYTLSIEKFSSIITNPFQVDGKINIEIRPLDVFAFGEIDGITNCVMIVQEYSELENYVEFTSNHRLEFNLLKKASEIIRANGFIVDLMPSNFLIDFNQEKSIYALQYLDYFVFNDPIFISEVQEIDGQITEGKISSNQLVVLKRS